MATRQMMARATEGTQAPTPGYLYKDLAVAASTNPAVCQEMAQYLINRLEKNNPNIKLKSLKLLAKIADQVPLFKRCLSQSTHAVAEIKAHIQFRGVIDPVRGDEPNQKIRSAAQEALDSVYRDTPTSISAGVSSGYAQAPVVIAGSRRMDGVGNPRYTDPRLDPRYNGTQSASIGEAVKEVGDVVLGMIKDPLARNVELPPAAGARGVPSRGFGELPQYNRSAVPPGAAELSRQTQGQWTMASNRGPNAVLPPASLHGSNTDNYQHDSDYNGGIGGQQTRASSGAVGGSWGNNLTNTAAVRHVNPSSSATPPPTALPVAQLDGSYERNLILELCPPSGLKAVPPPDKLSHFSKIVPSLNADLVCPALLDCLEEGQPWIIRAKALCVMETTLYSGASSATGQNPYRDFFHACQDEIIPLAGHPRIAIAGPAKRVLALLGVDSQLVDQAVAQNHEVSFTPATTTNLLDFDERTSTLAPSSSSTAAASIEAVQDGTLFGGMQVKVQSGATPTTSNATKVQIMGSSTSSSSTNLLEDFPVTNSQNATPAQDIFRVNDTTLVSSMFDQIALKASQEDKKTESEDAGDLSSLSPPVAAGSAFGFINNSDLSTLTAPVPPPPIHTVESFDPLKSFSPNTSKKSMTMSAEQMQAMAYQQIMMQQQHMQLQRMMMQQQQHQGMAYPQAGMMAGMPGVLPVMTVGMPSLTSTSVHGQHMTNAFAVKSASSNNNAPLAKKDDKKFDFVKDAMQNAGNK